MQVRNETRYVKDLRCDCLRWRTRPGSSAVPWDTRFTFKEYSAECRSITVVTGVVRPKNDINVVTEEHVAEIEGAIASDAIVKCDGLGINLDAVVIDGKAHAITASGIQFAEFRPA